MKKVQIFSAVDRIDGDLSTFAFLVVNGVDKCQAVWFRDDNSADEVTEFVRNDMQAQGFFGFPDSKAEPRRADMIDPTLHTEWEVK